MHRRDVLRAGAAIATALALPRWAREAGAAPPERKARNLIVVFAYGGWDTTYSLDPKARGGLVDPGEGELGRVGAIPLALHASRPKVRAFFEAFGARAAVVNGVQVRSIAHEECVKRVLTGTPSADHADVAATVAHAVGRDRPVPYLVLGPIALTGAYGSIAGRTGSVNQLRSLVMPDAELPPPRGAAPLADVKLAEGEDARVKAYLVASAERQRALRGQGAANARQIDDYVRSLDRDGLLRRFVKQGGGLGDFAYTPSLSVQSELAVRAFERDLSRAVMIGSGLQWDTHNGNEAQSSLHDTLFGGLHDLASRLEAAKLLDSTTVLVLSEMGRTPKLNAVRGKDHWPVTSALVFGAGVRGDRAIAGTNERLDAVAVDFTTGRPSSGGKQIQPANLAAAVLEMVGVDSSRHLHSAEPLHAIVA